MFYLLNAQNPENDYTTGKRIITAHFECDTVSDLPALVQTTYIARIGSTAHIIENNSMYAVKSSGVWCVQETGTDVYTKSEIDTMLSGKANTATTLAGYGITNAYTKTQTNNLLSDKANMTEVNAQCGAIANAGAKNVSRAIFTSGTNNGVTFTANSDGIVTANSIGTQSQNATLQSSTFLLKAGTYTFSCTENPQRDVTYDSYVYDVDNSRTVARDNPNDSPGSTFTLSVDTNVRINLRVTRTYTANNLVFSPMIRYSVIADNEYVPYAPTNRELYEMILALQ